MPINYAERIQETSPGSILQGKSVVGIYFGRESCPHCGPFLHSLVALLRHRSEATIVFVSRGASEADTMRYFDKMPRWAAMPHATVAGTLGTALAKRFRVTTIPALVLLESNGKVICTDARIRLAADPTGLEFPWPAPAGGRCKNPSINFAMGPLIGPHVAGHQAPSPPATPRHRSAGVVPGSALRPPRLPPPDGGQPPSFTEDKHEMAWHDNVVIDQDLACLVVARERATRAPAVPADIDNDIHRPPAEIHARARRGREAKRKSPPVIVDAGRPPRKPNRIATRGVPIVYPVTMTVVVDRERAQRNGSFVPRILA